MKKYISLILIIIILFNFIIFDILEKNRVYAEVITTSALSIKLFACILAGMGVYLANSNDYRILFNEFVENQKSILNDYHKIMKNVLIHRVIPNVKGRYEFIKDYINNLDFTPSSSYKNVVIKESGGIGIVHYGLPNTLKVSLNDGSVFSVGEALFKVEKRSGSNIYDVYQGGFWDGELIWNTQYPLAYSMSGKLYFEKVDEWGGYLEYDVMDWDDELNKGIPIGSGISVDSSISQPEINSIGGQQTTISIRKGTDIVDLPSPNIGVIADGFIGYSYGSLSEILADIEDLGLFDSNYLERLRQYNVEYTDVITSTYALENISVVDLPNVIPIPGVDEGAYPLDPPDIENPDIPIDPSLPIEPSFPIDTPVAIPDSTVLDESISEDSNVIGLGLITRLLRFIGNLLKLAIVTPINIIKNGIIAIYEVIKAIPSILNNILDYMKDIPSKLSEIIGKIGSTPWLNTLVDTVVALPSSIVNSIENGWTNFLEWGGTLVNTVTALPTTIVDSINAGWTNFLEWGGTLVDTVVAIPEKIEEIREGIPEKVEEIKTNVVEYIESLFLPTLELDFQPLQIVTIKDKFPFCLPFDILNIFNQLKTSPEIPKWEVNFLGSSLVLDFAQFESLAVIVRWAIVIIFIISLIKLYSIIFL